MADLPCRQCLCLLDDHVELAHAIRTYAVALVLDRILYVAAEDAGGRILFENDFVAVYEDFDGIFTILNVELPAQLFGKDDPAHFIDGPYHTD